MIRRLLLAALFASAAATAFAANGLVEPSLKMSPQHDGKVRVAMTLDACMGKTDHRILDTLVRERIPATIFVTARWLKHNSEALAVLMANPDLFEIENHGENHVPAVDKPVSIYGIAAAGSEAAVVQEVEGGRRCHRHPAAMVSGCDGQIYKLVHGHHQPARHARGGLLRQWRWRLAAGRCRDGQTYRCGEEWRCHHLPHQSAHPRGGRGRGEGPVGAQGTRRDFHAAGRPVIRAAGELISKVAARFFSPPGRRNMPQTFPSNGADETS